MPQENDEFADHPRSPILAIAIAAWWPWSSSPSPFLTQKSWWGWWSFFPKLFPNASPKIRRNHLFGIDVWFPYDFPIVFPIVFLGHWSTTAGWKPQRLGNEAPFTSVRTRPIILAATCRVNHGLMVASWWIYMLWLIVDFYALIDSGFLCSDW